MQGVFLAPKQSSIVFLLSVGIVMNNSAPQKMEVLPPSSQRSQRRFSSQRQHRRRFPSILSCSLWLKTEFTEVTERRFSSQRQHRRRFPSILSCSLWLKTEFSEVTETIFLSEAA
jgi:hypothetical protein